MLEFYGLNLLFSKSGAKVLLFFDMTKLFDRKIALDFILLHFVKSGPQNGSFIKYKNNYFFIKTLIYKIKKGSNFLEPNFLSYYRIKKSVLNSL